MSPEPFAGLSDEALASRFQETGEERYFSELVRRMRPRVLAACERLVGSGDAEDLTQEVCLRAYGRMGMFRDGNFAAWLYAIARNLCVNYLQTVWGGRRVAGVRELERRRSADNVEAVCVRDDEIAKMLALLGELPDEQRICVKLFHIDGLSYEKIVRQTGYTDTQVKSYIQNGRRMLRQKWNERHGGKQERR